MFQLAKKEFIRDNGSINGHKTRRTDVYYNLYRKMPVKDRLAAGNILQKYEEAYLEAFVARTKELYPGWNIGMRVPREALDGISR